MPFIDWTFFFTAWELKGTFPEILDDPQYGHAARELYDNAQALLGADHRAKRALTARASTASGPRASEGDDIVLYADESRDGGGGALPDAAPAGDASPTTSRTGRSPTSSRRPASGRRDYVGAFAVTAASAPTSSSAASSATTTTTTRSWSRRWPTGWPRRSPSACTRGSGASGATAGRAADGRRALAERYRGIRPAFGYPACPDHTEKGTLFALLGAEEAGIALTESCAMTPAASVSGLYFAHPRARYFVVGRIGGDQVADYARRKGISVDEAERWLSPYLSYEVAAVKC